MSNNHFLETIRAEFRKYKSMGEKAMAQLHTDAEMHWAPSPESNSMAIIVKHLHGNMMSRWTNFLTTDGEKPDRMRDGEFEPDNENITQLLQRWEEGWECTFAAIDPLQKTDLMLTVTIRQEPHTVTQALVRQLGHYAGHVGQMIYLAKMIRDKDWQTLSIPKKRR